jgi:hypothetical protein
MSEPLDRAAAVRNGGDGEEKFFRAYKRKLRNLFILAELLMNESV